MPTWGLNTILSTPGGTYSFKRDDTASTELNIIAEPLPTNSTDLLIAGAVRAAGIKKLLIVSTVACTLKTNVTSGGGGQVFSLLANQPIIWDAQSNGTNPITTDITKFYATVTTAGALTVLILSDPTV